MLRFPKTRLETRSLKFILQQITMIGQSKISSFFSTSASKRTASSGTGDSAQKKVKLSQASTEIDTDLNYSTPEKAVSPASQHSPSLTPEQKAKVEANKRAALARLQDRVASTSNDLAVNMGATWRDALSPEFSKPYFKELSAFVAAERKKGKVFPPSHQVFTWTQVCKITDVKVVILGQDPYHGPNQAHGLCFSVLPGITPPPSLQNMFKELTKDIEGFKHPGHGTLTGWATQGVLLLNACLTVRAHQANSHAGKGWEQLTDATISWLNKNSTGIVFMLWGSYAQKKGACIDKKRHHVLKTVHPSPLSAHRGFFGCKHFSQCNKLLKSGGKAPIDWTKLPSE